MSDTDPKKRGSQIGAAATEPLHIMIPIDLAGAIDAHVDEMRGMQPDQRVTRADAARAILRRGVVYGEKLKQDRARKASGEK